MDCPAPLGNDVKRRRRSDGDEETQAQLDPFNEGN